MRKLMQISIMVMNPNNNPSATLEEIRSLMERSTRFISLSGLSEVLLQVSLH